MTINKLLAAVVGTLVLGFQQYLADGTLSGVDWVLLISMVLAAVGTWLIPNTPVLAAAKTWVQAIVTGSGVLVPLLVDGFQQQDLWPTLIAILTAAGVYLVPGPIHGVVEGTVVSVRDEPLS